MYAANAGCQVFAVECPSLVACVHFPAGPLVLDSFSPLPILVIGLFSVWIATLEGQLKEQVGNQEAQ